MLVGLAEAVHPGRVQQRGPVRRLVLRDHLFPAAGIAGQGEAGERQICGDQSRVRQRAHEGDKAAGVAAGVGDQARGPDPFPLSRELRESVHPAGAGAVGRGGVDHPGVGIFQPADGLLGRRVGQAQERDVRFVERFAAAILILALFLRQGKQGEIPPPGQALKDAQAGGARTSVYEYFDHGVTPEKKAIKWKVSSHNNE